MAEPGGGASSPSPRPAAVEGGRWRLKGQELPGEDERSGTAVAKDPLGEGKAGGVS